MGQKRNSWRNILQVIRFISNVIGYKKSNSERHRLSEVKAGRKLHLQIVEQL